MYQLGATNATSIREQYRPLDSPPDPWLTLVMETAAPTISPFTVTLDCPGGQGQLDLMASSADRAGNRAWLSAVHLGWGDVDEVKVVSVEPCTDWPEAGF